jgi:hypothetical protein
VVVVFSFSISQSLNENKVRDKIKKISTEQSNQRLGTVSGCGTRMIGASASKPGR